MNWITATMIAVIILNTIALLAILFADHAISKALQEFEFPFWR